MTRGIARTNGALVSMTADEARELTDRINGAAGELWQLLLEAHDRQAWRALGYGSWQSYTDAEFNISRSYAYRLLDQGRVCQAISEASGVSPNGDITEAIARDIKPALPEVTTQIRNRVAAGERPETVVREVVAEARKKAPVVEVVDEPHGVDIAAELRDVRREFNASAYGRVSAFVNHLPVPPRLSDEEIDEALHKLTTPLERGAVEKQARASHSLLGRIIERLSATKEVARVSR